MLAADVVALRASYGRVMPAIPVDPFWDKRAYLQIADDVVHRIDAGEITLKLPGEREMAEEYGTAIGTVRRALIELRKRSTIETFHGRGSYVASELLNIRGEGGS